MTKFLLIGLLLLAACNEDKSSQDNVGRDRAYEPVVVSDQEEARIKAICTALADKESKLSVLVSNAAEYEFLYAQKTCGERALPEMKSVITQISGYDPYFNFVAKDGSTFGFNQVETTELGMMAEICTEVFDGRRLSSPMTTRGGAIWFTTNTNSGDCKNEEKAYCIHIQKGSISGRNTYKIHSDEWMKVSLSGTRRGFFTEKKLISSVGCPDSESFERKAILR